MPRVFSAISNQAAWLACSLLIVLCTPALAGNSDQTRTYLTRIEVNQQPSVEATDQFDCSDRIYLVIETQALKTGEHTLEVGWFDPQDKQREFTRFPYHAAPVTRVWAWLQLHGSKGAIIGQFFDPSSGMEEFIGGWRVMIEIDNVSIGEAGFQVLC